MTEERPVAPLYNRVYGGVVYWITFATCLICLIGPAIAVIWPDATAMNPYFTFALIFEGKGGVEIWRELYGTMPYLHSIWWNYFFTGDGLLVFGMAVGCTVAVWALIPTIFAMARDGVYGYAIFSLVIIFMILFAATGFVEMEVPE